MSASSNLDTEGTKACFYANKSDTRPTCEGVAIIAYDTIALCASCDARRSTVGKGIVPRRLVVKKNYLAEITKAVGCAAEAQRSLDESVMNARQHGSSWTIIATALGISRQAAHQRYAMTAETRQGGNLT